MEKNEAVRKMLENQSKYVELCDKVCEIDYKDFMFPIIRTAYPKSVWLEKEADEVLRKAGITTI